VGNSTTIDIKANNKGLKAELDESEALVNKFANGIKIALAAAAGAFVISKIAGSFGDWISAASEAIDATAKLEAIVSKTGGTAGYTSKQLEQMADDVEKLTGIQAETVQQAQALLLVFDNIRGDQFDRATKAAADLSKALNIDVVGAARMVGKALDDPIDAVNALARAGVDFTNDQKEMIKTMAESGDIVGAQITILDALDSKVGGVAEAMGQTFSGQVAILGAKFGDLAETLGGAIIPYIEALLPAAEIAVGGLQQIVDMIADFAGAGEDFQTSFADVITSALKYVTEIFVNSFTYTLAFFETWGQQVERATYGVFLVFVSSFEDLKKWLTVDIPAYLEWFGENWQNIFTDLAAFTMTVVSNMYDNLVNFWTNVFDWLQGNKTNWEWKGLTDGFTATLKALPEIAARELSDTEQYLKASMDQIGQSINETFQQRQAEGQAFIDKMFAAPDAKEKQIPTESNKARRQLGKPTDAKDSKDSKLSAGQKLPVSQDVKGTGGQIVAIDALYNKISSGGSSQDMGIAQVAVGQAMQIQQQQQQAAIAKNDNAVMVNKIVEAILGVNIAISKLNVGLD
jgi:hypothetical protein